MHVQVAILLKWISSRSFTELWRKLTLFYNTNFEVRVALRLFFLSAVSSTISFTKIDDQGNNPTFPLHPEFE